MARRRRHRKPEHHKAEHHKKKAHHPAPKPKPKPKGKGKGPDIPPPSSGGGGTPGTISATVATPDNTGNTDNGGYGDPGQSGDLTGTTDLVSAVFGTGAADAPQLHYDQVSLGQAQSAQRMIAQQTGAGGEGSAQ